MSIADCFNSWCVMVFNLVWLHSISLEVLWDALFFWLVIYCGRTLRIEHGVCFFGVMKKIIIRRFVVGPYLQRQQIHLWRTIGIGLAGRRGSNVKIRPKALEGVFINFVKVLNLLFNQIFKLLLCIHLWESGDECYQSWLESSWRSEQDRCFDRFIEQDPSKKLALIQNDKHLNFGEWIGAQVLG